MHDSISSQNESESRRRRRLEILVFVFPFIIVAGLLALKVLRPGYYFRIAVREDGPFEYLTAISYLTASVFLFLSWRASRSLGNRFVSFGFLAAGILFFLIFGEEISWGQRILGIETPDSIAEAIDRLLTDRNLADSLGVEGRRRATEVFTWENCKRTMLQALDK